MVGQTCWKTKLQALNMMELHHVYLKETVNAFAENSVRKVKSDAFILGKEDLTLLTSRVTFTPPKLSFSVSLV